MRKLTDIVTSLWLEIIVLPKELFYEIPVFLGLLNNIIIGINELYVCKYWLDLDLTLMNIWRDNYYLESDYDSKTKLSIIFLFAYIGAQSDLTQVMTLKKKSEAQPLS